MREYILMVFHQYLESAIAIGIGLSIVLLSWAYVTQQRRQHET